MRIELMAQLWNDGKNSYQIARVCGLPEHVVYNRLSEITALARQRRMGYE